MAIKTAEATWTGSLKEGRGHCKLQSGLELDYSFATRFEDKSGSNPEELIGAALASCYAMALCAQLTKQQISYHSMQVIAKVHLNKVDNGFQISPIELVIKPAGISLSQPEFQQQCEITKANCPVSKILAGTEITLAIQMNT